MPKSGKRRASLAGANKSVQSSRQPRKVRASFKNTDDAGSAFFESSAGDEGSTFNMAEAACKEIFDNANDELKRVLNLSKEPLAKIRRPEEDFNRDVWMDETMYPVNTIARSQDGLGEMNKYLLEKGKKKFTGGHKKYKEMAKHMGSELGEGWEGDFKDTKHYRKFVGLRICNSPDGQFLLNQYLKESGKKLFEFTDHVSPVWKHMRSESWLGGAWRWAVAGGQREREREQQDDKEKAKTSTTQRADAPHAPTSTRLQRRSMMTGSQTS